VAPRNPPGNQPWHRTTGAIVTAGGVGAALLAVLVVTVVQYSDDWGQVDPTVLTTPPVLATTTETRASEPFIITPSDTSSSYPTSVSVSTSDFGLPGATTSGTDTTSSTTSSSSRTAGSEPSDEDATPTTTRKRPRLNETRIGAPP
jgi:hypothetical protein